MRSGLPNVSVRLVDSRYLFFVRSPKLALKISSNHTFPKVKPSIGQIQQKPNPKQPQNPCQTPPRNRLTVINRHRHSHPHDKHKARKHKIRRRKPIPVDMLNPPGCLRAPTVNDYHAHHCEATEDVKGSQAGFLWLFLWQGFGLDGLLAFEGGCGWYELLFEGLGAKGYLTVSICHNISFKYIHKKPKYSLSR